MSSSPSPLHHQEPPLPISLHPNQPSPAASPSLSSSLSLPSTSSPESSPSSDRSHIFIPNKTRSFSSIPFSWEKLPGIPKRQLSKKVLEPSLNLLPLPPTPSKKYESRSFRNDPFLKAFVECSKDEGSNKITRSLSDRFGFVSMYASCKRSCPVTDSVIHFPKPQKHYLFN